MSATPSYCGLTLLVLLMLSPFLMQAPATAWETIKLSIDDRIELLYSDHDRTFRPTRVKAYREEMNREASQRNRTFQPLMLILLPGFPRTIEDATIEPHLDPHANRGPVRWDNPDRIYLDPYLRKLGPAQGTRLTQIRSPNLTQLCPALNWYFITWPSRVPTVLDPNVHYRGPHDIREIVAVDRRTRSVRSFNLDFEHGCDGFAALLREQGIKVHSLSDAQQVYEALCELNRGRVTDSKLCQLIKPSTWRLGIADLGDATYYVELQLDDAQRVVEMDLCWMSHASE